ncbi:STAS domain-containing protein [Natronosporangium hydrolyticum]|uniref:STAS domain-containing protein n=1 Tax=Natronosporangium hydrolyticum TaxID=2811111 RepID=A0A895Y649_9ACTN|nr:STAS domain-containing protein [Natronosporangium hydrolyticum]QSB13217.1 STAS domain-containing protein [Natronosporangium hydrolyticum]
MDDRALRSRLADTIGDERDRIVDSWVQAQVEQGAIRAGFSEDDVRQEAYPVIAGLAEALAADGPVRQAVSEAAALRSALSQLSLTRAQAGASSSATASAVLALKEVMLPLLRERAGDDRDLLLDLSLTLSRVVDAAGLVVFQSYLQGREEIIRRQTQEIQELSTPVVQLWRQILAVPLIGTLDSARVQVVMENLLHGIKEHEAKIAILDITGVPTVDTVVAQHLMQTVAAARLMGADCIISGIRPQIAQTIAQLGIDLSTIMTRATLADALTGAISVVTEGAGGETPGELVALAR